jgi:hypothetical protein
MLDPYHGIDKCRESLERPEYGVIIVVAGCRPLQRRDHGIFGKGNFPSFAFDHSCPVTPNKCRVADARKGGRV